MILLALGANSCTAKPDNPINENRSYVRFIESYEPRIIQSYTEKNIEVIKLYENSIWIEPLIVRLPGSYFEPFLERGMDGEPSIQIIEISEKECYFICFSTFEVGSPKAILSISKLVDKTGKNQWELDSRTKLFFTTNYRDSVRLLLIENNRCDFSIISNGIEKRLGSIRFIAYKDATTLDIRVFH